MIDDSDGTQVAKASSEEITNFILKNSLNVNCPVCDHNDWIVANRDKENLALLVVPDTGVFRVPPVTLPVAALICDKCGYVQMHALAIIGRK